MKSGGAPPAGCSTVSTGTRDELGMVNVSRGAGQQEMQAAQFTINWGSCVARSA